MISIKLTLICDERAHRGFPASTKVKQGYFRFCCLPVHNIMLPAERVVAVKQ